MFIAECSRRCVDCGECPCSLWVPFRSSSLSTNSPVANAVASTKTRIQSRRFMFDSKRIEIEHDGLPCACGVLLRTPLVDEIAGFGVQGPRHGARV